ncbi:MAG: iron ABC transporter permease [Paracoccaceae bacterium]
MHQHSTNLAPDSAKIAVERAFRVPVLGGVLVLLLLLLIGLGGALYGAADIPLKSVLIEFLRPLSWLNLDSGLSETQSTIIWQWRLPRVALAVLVGASLSVAGASYQGVFRNPLADPFLLGAAAGAGLGATLAITSGVERVIWNIGTVPLAAFVGSLTGVFLSTMLSRAAGRSTASLLLAGIATASFLTAWQTYLLQQNMDTIREVYSWLMGNLSTSGWGEVNLILPYFVVCFIIAMAHRKELDLLRLSDDEAISLGGHPKRTRIILILAASLLTAIAVSVSGLIAFVGLVVPHVIRLAVGSSYRVIIPLSALAGGAFLCMADIFARNVISPGELPIGVVTAFVGAPFFALLLRLSKSAVQ